MTVKIIFRDLFSHTCGHFTFSSLCFCYFVHEVMIDFFNLPTCVDGTNISFVQTTPTFKDIQKLIATKLDHSKVTNESTSDARPTTRALMAPGIQSVPVASADLQRKVAACHLPPPPPPPLPPRATLKGAIIPKAPVISLSGSRNHDKPVVMSAHSNLVGEIQKRSTHLLAVSILAFSCNYDYI